MGKKDFDNLMKVLKVENLYAAGTAASQEVDFELPRGFIAKIFKMVFEVVEIGEDIEGVVVDSNLSYTMGLHRDPDETTNVQIPRGSVQHDGIADFFVDVSIEATGTNEVSAKRFQYDIPEHIDLITARNMRFNSVAGGPQVALATEAFAQCAIYYTLEKVTDDDILEILDIL